MDRFSLCECSECGSQFALSSELIENTKEVTCPICESRFDAPEEEPTGRDNLEDEDDIDEEDKDDDEEKEEVLQLTKNLVAAGKTDQ